MDKPLVSICCLAYNHEPFIRQCLDGFFMQKNNFEFEVLIHDDASTDRTADIIREYELKYPSIIKPIYQTENQYIKKIGISRTFQFPRAKGKYIALCEGDDYWTDPQKLQKQIDFLETHPDYSFSHTSFKYLNSETGEFRESTNEDAIIKDLQKRSLDDIREKILDHNIYRIQTMTVVFRKESYNELVESDKFLYQSGYFMMGDTQLWIGLLLYGKLHYLEDITAVYRMHNNSLCRTSDIEKKIRFQLSSYEMRFYMLSKDRYSWQLKFRVKKGYCITLWKYLIINPNFSPKIRFGLLNFIIFLMRNSLIRYLSRFAFEYKYKIRI